MCVLGGGGDGVGELRCVWGEGEGGGHGVGWLRCVHV